MLKKLHTTCVVKSLATVHKSDLIFYTEPESLQQLMHLVLDITSCIEIKSVDYFE